MNEFSPNYRCYAPSGVFSLPGALVTLVLGLVAAVPLAFLYSFGVYHVPSVYISFCLTLGLGWALGLIVSFGVVRFRIRNRVVAVSIALLAALAAYIVHWPAYVAVLLARENDAATNVPVILTLALRLIQNPSDLIEVIKEIYEIGVWTIRSSSSSGAGSTVNGLFLGAVWVAEFCAVMWIPSYLAHNKAGLPYSEQSEKWLVPFVLPLPIAYVENLEELKSAFARNDFSALTTPLPQETKEPSDERYGQVTLYRDIWTPYLSVTNVSFKGKGKKKKKEEKGVVRFLSVTPSLAQNVASSLGGTGVSVGFMP